MSEAAEALKLDLSYKSPDELADIIDKMLERLEPTLLPVLTSWRDEEMKDPTTAAHIPDAMAMCLAVLICTEASMWLGGNVGEAHRRFVGRMLDAVELYCDGMLDEGSLEPA